MQHANEKLTARQRFTAVVSMAFDPDADLSNKEITKTIWKALMFEWHMRQSIRHARKLVKSYSAVQQSLSVAELRREMSDL